ncbi:MAG: S41 family peptidase [Phycisphaerae bacterium]|nr:S41 family peptidase [Phycisphaerae bacterium]
MVPHHNQPPGVMEGTPRGLYALTSHVRGMGPFTGSTTALIAAEPTKDGFRANSRPGAAGELLGGIPGFFVTLFGNKHMPGGAFLHWRSPLPEGDGFARGVVSSPAAQLHAHFYSCDRAIELHSTGDERVFGLMTLKPANATEYPMTDFPALVDRIDATLKENLFDPAAYDTPGTQTFLRRLRAASRKARDDAEFLMAWILAAGHLPFTHCYMGRELNPEFESRLTETSDISPFVPPEAITLTEDQGIVTLQIAHFDGESYDEIDAAFAEISERNPRGLIIDLRGNPGGTYIAGRVAAHLVESPVDMGVFFGRRARARVLAGELDEFPVVTSISSIDEFNSLIQEHGAFRAKVEPVEPVYSGPVAVLVNRKVASACEPLVAGLQEAKRATIIGERTAGAMLSVARFEVGEGWILWVPTLDYLTGMGVRLDGRGVVPDVVTPAAGAPAAARKLMSAVHARESQDTGEPG